MFRGLFSRKKPPRDASFQVRVLRLATDRFPELDFEAGEDETAVLVDGWQLGLTNLVQSFDGTDGSDAALLELIEEYVKLMLAEDDAAQAWPAAAACLRPQLITADFGPDYDVATLPFGATLAACAVMDSEHRYVHVTKKQAEAWGQSIEALMEIATRNLEDASHGMSMSASGDDEQRPAFVVVSSGDGYDAARVLMPGLRKFMAERLGRPYCFGVPNRDFVVFWREDAAAEALDFIARGLEEDFAAQPDPLSPNVFTVDGDGRIDEQIA